MQITVSGKHVDLSDVLRIRVWRYLDDLDRRYRDAVAAQITFSRERRVFTCEISVQIADLHVRSVAGAADAYQAFDKAYDRLATRVAEARSRRYDRRTASTVEIGYRALLRPED